MIQIFLMVYATKVFFLSNMIIKLVIEYDGTNYIGWQKQENGKSIQSEIEKSLSKIFKKKITIHVAGRTDSGVHALGQVAHFEVDTKIQPKQIAMAINYHLGKKNHIVILKSSKEKKTFHSRFSALERIYEYKILNRVTPSPLYRDRMWFVPFDIDTKLLESSAQVFMGKHDFNSFRSSECQARNSIRTINKIEIIKLGHIITLRFAARSFLHNQVRIIVGSLINVGRKFWDKKKLEQILVSKDRRLAGQTAPARGLYLKKIRY